MLVNRTHMASRDSSANVAHRHIGGTVELWLGLGHGWQAVLLGWAIVFACHLLA